ncbi:copper homeostasis protein cutC homolog [Centruroides sculpturatus]|uniref:copper homeostasis protein cutC homolog n=1 Tax=Centruroides sculpturatus TaxID=218467 RepID=UPI000C6D81C1|nr:copper homeostasis protein cutC homolog [Centruroides sculpturatus]
MKIMSVKLEVCVDSLASAINAYKGGASRLELCSCLSEGGLTPSLGFLKIVRLQVKIPIFVLIRPRGGDFTYSNEEFQIMKEDIKIAKENGADGFVLGALTSSGKVDEVNCKLLIDEASPLPVTFHRGEVYNFYQIKKIIIMPAFIIIISGGGVNEGNIKQLLKINGIQEIHSSASSYVENLTSYMTDDTTDNFGIKQKQCDVLKLKNLIAIIKQFSY